LIGIRGRAEQVSALAGHGVVLALGLLLVVPIVLGRHPQPEFAVRAWPGTSDIRAAAAPRSPMAFEQTRNARPDGSDTAVSVERVPAPQPVAPVISVGALAFAPPAGTGGVGVQAIYDVFSGSSGLAWALRVARCESHYDPLAVNVQSGASGLFQFMPATWHAHFAGWNIWDPYAQARAALSFYNQGALNAWACK
jgi:hypothetical protein